MIGDAPTFETLDDATMKHHLKLVKSMYCARPVMVDGRNCFVQFIRHGLEGGHVEMVVWLTGGVGPIKAELITIPDLTSN